MFIKGDIYTASGSNKLYHCWTDKVTKFDSSSFYNWEQDNLPLYDLDERTYYLWEQLGYPTSSIPGVALVVSADAPNAAVACNKNIFRTVSAAIEALPQAINYPIIIEVANFGQLGDIVLNNYKFGPRGSLEIINRNFAKQECTVSTVADTFGSIGPMSGLIDGTAGNVFQYLSGVAAANFNASSIKTSPLQGFLDSSCLSISSAVFSGTRDVRLSGAPSKLSAYVSIRKGLGNYSRSTLVIDDKNTINPYAANDYDLKFKAYDLNADSFDAITTKDASTINYFNNAQIYLTNGWPDAGTTTTAYNGLYFGNKTNKIVISNCDGPIFLRNFFLDGSGANKTTNFNGVEVNNSPNIYLENIVVTRYRKAGFNITNSNVTLLRGCVATRIYDFNSAGVRKTDNYDARRKFITYNITSSMANDDMAAGIVANNSTITVSSTHDFEYSLMKSVLGTTSNPFVPHYYIFEFTKNANGIILNNSTLQGGKTQDHNQTIKSFYETDFELAHNIGAGILAFNSKISMDGKLRLLENLNGAVLNNSILEVDKLHCVANQHKGIKALNSQIIYNKNFNKFHDSGSKVDLYLPVNYFSNNGQHLNLDNSKMLPVMGSSMELYYDRFTFLDAIGKFSNDITDTLGPTESIKIDNNSEVVLISPYIRRTSAFTNNNVLKGSELSVKNNSRATLRGAKYFATRVIGPNSYGDSHKLAAICAANNSQIIINGPTVVAQFGVDILAENNSRVSLSPPKNDLDSKLDVSSISLIDPENHTAVELHSVKSCIVADNKSVIDIKDLGSYKTCWSRSGDYTTYTASGITYDAVGDQIELYTSAGSLQFYPNPTPSRGGDAYGTMLGADNLDALITAAGDKFDSATVSTRGLRYLQDLNPASPFLFSSVTFGGMCVRALNDSTIKVDNVNFPTGFWNCSAPYYDGGTTFDSGGACYRTFIWNIADNSQLKASLISISGVYPTRAGYVGPLGVWTSGTGASSVAYGLPSSTPDTSAASILDFFGRNPSGIAFTVSSAQNYGPFRLYFSVNPMANSLVYNSTRSGYGIIPQIYAQGYQPSSGMTCSGAASSLYTMCLQRNSAGSIQPSGYYYGNDIMNNPDYIRVLVDESAANSFANAKHCAVGKSNNARPVAIYYPYHTVNQGDSTSLYGIGSVNLFDIERTN
jgi:hypothetical protein